MNIIIDTNVIVSSLIRGRKPKKVIEFVNRSPDYHWFVSEEILAEYRDVITRDKFHLAMEVINDWFQIFSRLELIKDNHIEISFPQDPKDERFIRCAIAAKADYFITGDGDFKGITEISGTKIISVSEFARIHNL